MSASTCQITRQTNYDYAIMLQVKDSMLCMQLAIMYTCVNNFFFCFFFVCLSLRDLVFQFHFELYYLVQLYHD